MAILHDCTDANYWQIDAINASALKTYIHDPIQYYNRYVKKVLPPITSDAMTFGSALHCKILEPDQFDSRFIVKPEGLNLTTKEGREWKESVADRKIVNNDEIKLIEAMSIRCLEIPSFEFELGKHQKELVITSEFGGTWLKSKVDWLIEFDDKIINCDIKTMASIDDRSIVNSIYKFGYDIQAAFYAHNISSNFDNRPVDTYLMCVAKESANARLVRINDFVDAALDKTFTGLQNLIMSRNTGIYRSVYPDVSNLTIPDWKTK